MGRGGWGEGRLGQSGKGEEVGQMKWTLAGLGGLGWAR